MHTIHTEYYTRQEEGFRRPNAHRQCGRIRYCIANRKAARDAKPQQGRGFNSLPIASHLARTKVLPTQTMRWIRLGFILSQSPCPFA